jgi:hypothetical protein
MMACETDSRLMCFISNFCICTVYIICILAGVLMNDKEHDMILFTLFANYFIHG